MTTSAPDRAGRRTGGELLVEALRRRRIPRLFCVPGESFLPVLDALVDAPEIEVVTCRQEGGAAFMAEADGRLSGRPGICIVTRGPGATNASIGVHAARQSGTPMILLVGQAARPMLGREAFQEIDIAAMFAPIAKWAALVPDASRVEEYVERAWRTACAGRPGPVVLALPEDVLSSTVVDEPRDPAPPPGPVPAVLSVDSVESVMAELAAARSPLVVVGGGSWSQAAAEQLATWAEANALPVAVEFRCQDYLDNDSPSYVGDLGLAPSPGLLQLLAEADVVLAIGTRLGEIMTQGYQALRPPRPRQRLIHIHPDPAELGSVFEPSLALAASATAAVAALADLRLDDPPWRGRTEAARSRHLEWSRPDPDPVHLDAGAVVAALGDLLTRDAVVTNGAGNYTSWLQRFHRFHTFGTQLGPASGAMGYGLPAAIAAKLHDPSRVVVAFAGDGCFLMNGQELATAVTQQLEIVVIVVNNSGFGTIRMHQERHYPGRVKATELANPDFTRLAEAYGAASALVTSLDEVRPALERALAHRGGPFLVEVRVDPALVTPTSRLAPDGGLEPR